MVDKLLEEKGIVKIEKKLGTDFVNDLRSLSITDLEKRLLALAKYNEEILEAQKADGSLEDAKNLVKELNAPYKESLTDNKLRRNAVYLILQEKGADTTK